MYSTTKPQISAGCSPELQTDTSLVNWEGCVIKLWGGVGLALVVSLQLAWQPGWDGTAGGSDFDGAGVTVHRQNQER